MCIRDRCVCVCVNHVYRINYFVSRSKNTFCLKERDTVIQNLSVWPNCGNKERINKRLPDIDPVICFKTVSYTHLDVYKRQ